MISQSIPIVRVVYLSQQKQSTLQRMEDLSYEKNEESVSTFISGRDDVWPYRMWS